VPIDFSKMSVQAIDTAKLLAQRYDATVHLAHVHQLDYPAGFTAPMPPLMPFSLVNYEQDEKKRLAHQLRTLADKYGLSRTSCHLLGGAPAFDEICRLANELPADLIVMPTHGRSGFKHVFLGSTAERVVQHSPCSVFVAREDKRRSKKGPASSINTILVPVDFSGCSLQGLRYAISFAEKFAARVILLHAIQITYPYTSDRYALYDLSVVTNALKKDAERRMRTFVRLAKFGPVKFETAIANGQPASAICAFARSHHVDLIITSTHGRTGFEHVLIGSTAEQVVRHAPCPVLVAPSHPKTRVSSLARRAGGRTIKRQVGGNGARKEKSFGPMILTRKVRMLSAHASPERRKTNKFRESHPHGGRSAR
jgi:nucleotide-binding universal stress UspA family protein